MGGKFWAERYIFRGRLLVGRSAKLRLVKISKGDNPRKKVQLCG